MANWSKVKHFPPFSKILFLAVSVNLRAQTLSFGHSSSLTSFVTVEHTTIVLS